eukprot:TRINITY_DN68_c0_g2_i2.p1 TRINITY_DN68_c0_g2~~TRINITY_DN68_c0_g2_i2.p1  ORF type:complete len:148 (-),score=40.77 TRINITY_DN68_c0_g2_i2:48-491(-)
MIPVEVAQQPEMMMKMQPSSPSQQAQSQQTQQSPQQTQQQQKPQTTRQTTLQPTLISRSETNQTSVTLHEVLPRQGLLFSEKGGLTEALSKPMLLPIKSLSLEKIEKLQNDAIQIAAEKARPFTASRPNTSQMGYSSSGRPTTSSRQ